MTAVKSWHREAERLRHLAEEWQQRALLAEAQLARLGIPRGQQSYDRDPEALAWARAHVERCIARRERQQTKGPCHQIIIEAIRQDLLTGLIPIKGPDRGFPYLGAFDQRKPALSAELAAREATW